jgi:Protein of unknown function (DUF2735)
LHNAFSNYRSCGILETPCRLFIEAIQMPTNGFLERTRSSAKLYSFPRGGRLGLNAKSVTSIDFSGVEATAPAGVIYGGSWYHQDAISEAEHAELTPELEHPELNSTAPAAPGFKPIKA